MTDTAIPFALSTGAEPVAAWEISRCDGTPLVAVVWIDRQMFLYYILDDGKVRAYPLGMVSGDTDVRLIGAAQVASWGSGAPEYPELEVAEVRRVDMSLWAYNDHGWIPDHLFGRTGMNGPWSPTETVWAGSRGDHPVSIRVTPDGTIHETTIRATPSHPEGERVTNIRGTAPTAGPGLTGSMIERHAIHDPDFGSLTNVRPAERNTDGH